MGDAEMGRDARLHPHRQTHNPRIRTSLIGIPAGVKRADMMTRTDQPGALLMMNCWALNRWIGEPSERELRTSARSRSASGSLTVRCVAGTPGRCGPAPGAC